jgi:histone H3/H4
MSHHDRAAEYRTNDTTFTTNNLIHASSQTNGKRNRNNQRKKNGSFDYTGMNSVSNEQKRSQFKKAIPRVHVKQVVRETVDDWSLSPGQLRVSPDAIDLLHEVAEDYLISVMQATVMCTVHAKRRTTFVSDMRLATTLLNGQQLAAIRGSWKRFIRRKKEQGQDLPKALSEESAQFPRVEVENDDSELDVSDEV